MIGSPLHTFGERALAGTGLLILAGLVILAALELVAERDRLQPAQRVWRRFNGICVGLLALVAIDLLPDLADETELLHRADEVVIEVIALSAVVWFLAGRGRRMRRTTLPLWLLGVGELTKLLAIPIEWENSNDVQGDIVLALIGLPVLAVLVAWYWQLSRTQAQPA